MTEKLNSLTRFTLISITNFARISLQPMLAVVGAEVAVLVRLLLTELGLVELFDCGFDADAESLGLTVENVVVLLG